MARPGTSQRTLWLVRETNLARLYLKKPPKDPKTDVFNEVWVPRSIVEHTSKMGIQHIVTLPDWFLEERGL